MNSARVKPVFVVCSMLGGLVPLGAAAKDCVSACTADEQITSRVKASLRQHTELGIPNAIRVQTHNGVVYLYGDVATSLQRDEAIELAQQVADVKKVVATIATDNVGR
jgi:osmotically-inducible protein OsmY